ncbi:MAG TPA: circularly permuted type 2 ATP-grasp protein, partial [Actinokineospora sp.]|nr:circularly permuted type 2 ATP-grasp protein [Actinokineospora sp.]
IIGPRASDAELAAVRRRIEADPRGWIAQEVVPLSRHPTLIDGKPAPRHIDLRPFVITRGDDVDVIPGGLTRVALRDGSLIVNSSQGGGSKDTWVLAARSSTMDSELSGAGLGVGGPRDDIAPERGPELSTAQQQQQQQQSREAVDARAQR